MKKQIGAILASAAIFVAQIPPAMAEPADAETARPLADLVMIYKSSHKLVLFNNRKPLGTYKIHLGFAPVGDKVREGDGRTPEGTYYINRRNANSAYHLSLGLSYPNAGDIAQAAALGVNPGGDIFIHGGPTNPRDRFKQDWTAGCIAVSDREIEEIWSMVPLGTPVIVVP